MGELPDVYQYENIPSSLRVQIVHIMNDALGDHGNHKTIENFKFIHDTLCREYGKFSLIEKEFFEYENYIGDVINFIIQCNNTNHILDVVELSFQKVGGDLFANTLDYK
ncbi:AbiJ-NTD4 domain-containing protein [Nostoc sp.]